MLAVIIVLVLVVVGYIVHKYVLTKKDEPVSSSIAPSGQAPIVPGINGVPITLGDLGPSDDASTPQVGGPSPLTPQVDIVAAPPINPSDIISTPAAPVAQVDPVLFAGPFDIINSGNKQSINLTLGVDDDKKWTFIEYSPGTSQYIMTTTGEKTIVKTDGSTVSEINIFDIKDYLWVIDLSDIWGGATITGVDTEYQLYNEGGSKWQFKT
jgi:hypothetical protein